MKVFFNLMLMSTALATAEQTLAQNPSNATVPFARVLRCTGESEFIPRVPPGTNASIKRVPISVSAIFQQHPEIDDKNLIAVINLDIPAFTAKIQATTDPSKQGMVYAWLEFGAVQGRDLSISIDRNDSEGSKHGWISCSVL